ncbi:MAG: N-acetylmuramoyl-L-alanine amidase-like domain-containing protein [Bacteroidota bacterium]
MKRRDFLAFAALLPLLPACAESKNGNGSKAKAATPTKADTLSKVLSPQDKQAASREIFKKVVEKAKAENWVKLPIGESMANIGLMLLGTDYVGGTLDGEGGEVCRVDFTGLDCVTFFEVALGTSRILRKGKDTFEDLVNEITMTRYRAGKLDGYTSRLHYTGDWIYDNEKKGVIKDVTKEIGGEKFPLHVDFMSTHPKFYAPLEADSTLVGVVANQEKAINARQYFYVPKGDVAKIAPLLKTGDIIAISTNIKGLDYSHTGMAYRDEKGVLRFLHASQTKKKVILDQALHDYLAGVKSQTGITVARPQEVKI